MQTPRPARRTARPARDGAPEAVRLPGRFEHFYLEEYPKVVALAYALSGSRAGAEDIAQEAFLRAYQDWERVGSYEHQAAWVRRVAANLATSGLRRRLVEARVLARLAAGREPSVDPLAGEDAEFWAAVRALPRRQAQAVALYYFVAGGLVWVSGVAYSGIQPVVRVDPATKRKVDTVPTGAEGALAVGGGSVWQAGIATRTVYRLDPRSGRKQAEIPVGVVAKYLTAADGSLWVGSDSGRVIRIDMATNKVTGTFQVAGPGPAVALGEGSVWVVDSAHAALLRIQPTR